MRVTPDHITLSHPLDLDQAMRDFYGRALGLPRLEKTSGRRDVGGWFDLGGLVLHLSADPVDIATQAADPRHLAFSTDDLDACASAITAHGGWLIDDPRPPKSHRRLFACDPAGNRVEIVEKPADAAPSDQTGRADGPA